MSQDQDLEEFSTETILSVFPPRASVSAQRIEVQCHGGGHSGDYWARPGRAMNCLPPRTHHTPYHIYPTYPMSPEVYIKPICLKMFTREWPGYELSPLGSTIPYTPYTHHTPCLLPKVLSAYLINPKVASLSSHQATRPPYFKSRSSGSQFSWQHLHSDNHKMNFKYIYANWQ